MKQDSTEEIDKITDEEKRRAKRRAMIRRKRKRQTYLARFLVFMIAILTLGGIFVAARHVVRVRTGDMTVLQTPVDTTIREILIPKKRVYICPEVIPALIRPNEYSRPGEELAQIKNIFVHYTANPGTSALQNRDYFDGLSESHITSASAHFIIGTEGEILQCLPMDEIAYAVKGRNYDSVSIECCYIDENGEFTEATRQSLVELCAYLIGKYDLTEYDLMRHYDEGGKLCPKYYVEHADEWKRLVNDVGAYISHNGTTSQPEEMTDSQIIETDAKTEEPMAEPEEPPAEPED